MDDQAAYTWNEDGQARHGSADNLRRHFNKLPDLRSRACRLVLTTCSAPHHVSVVQLLTKNAMRKPCLIVLFTLLLCWIGCDSGGDDLEEQNAPELKLTVQKQQTSGTGGPTFMFTYEVPVESHVTLSFRDEDNQELQRLVNELQQSGMYATKLDASNYPNGMYRYRLEVVPTNGAEVLLSTGKIEIKR